MIKFDKCTKKYGNFTAVSELNVEINEGEIFGFLGPNGAGKSTSIKMLLQLLEPTKGNVYLENESVKDFMNSKKENIGYLPSDISFPKGTTAQDMVDLGLKMRNKDFEYSKELFERFELEPKTKIHKMSKGMRQKTGIIQAIAHKPKILILDEPHTGLDPLMQHEFNQVLLELKQSGTTILLSSHILADIEQLSDRIGIINNGNLLYDGTIKQMKQELPYRITLHTEKTLDKEFLARIKAKVLSHTEKYYLLESEADAQNILKETSKLSITDVSIARPPLEEIFHRYYQKGEKE